MTTPPLSSGSSGALANDRPLRQKLAELQQILAVVTVGGGNGPAKAAQQQAIMERIQQTTNQLERASSGENKSPPESPGKGFSTYA